MSKRTLLYILYCCVQILFSTLFISEIEGNNSLDYEGLFVQESPQQLAPPQEKKLVYRVPIKHGQGDHIQSLISRIYPGLSCHWDPLSQQLFISSLKSKIPSIKRRIRQMDKKLQQVKMEIKIVEVGYTNFDQYKHLFSDISKGFKVNMNLNTKKVNTTSELEGTLLGLIRNGKAKVLAKPVISTLENKEAIIKVGDRIPYVTTTVQLHEQKVQVNHIDTGIDIVLTPKVLDNNIIEVDIKSKISSIKVWKTFGDVEYPILSNRETETQVHLKNKETLIIAGLIDEQSKENISRVPILSYLPIIGGLFQSKQMEITKSDILFMISPEVVGG